MKRLNIFLFCLVFTGCNQSSFTISESCTLNDLISLDGTTYPAAEGSPTITYKVTMNIYSDENSSVETSNIVVESVTSTISGVACDLTATGETAIDSGNCANGLEFSFMQVVPDGPYTNFQYTIQITYEPLAGGAMQQAKFTLPVVNSNGALPYNPWTCTASN